MASIGPLKDSGANCAVTKGDLNLWSGNGLPNPVERKSHGICHRTGHDQRIGVAWRGYYVDAMALDVVVTTSESCEFLLTAIAASGVDVSDLQRPDCFSHFYSLSSAIGTAVAEFETLVDQRKVSHGIASYRLGE